MKFIIILLGFFLLKFNVIAQKITAEMQFNVDLYNSKLEEIVLEKQQQGFEIVREQKLYARAGYDLELNLSLNPKTLYSLVFVGDPSTFKIVASLAQAEIGYIFTDRIKTGRDNEFWTEFQYPCELGGVYMFTVLQKNYHYDNPLGYFMLLKKMR
jgi:hypothetical protein